MTTLASKLVDQTCVTVGRALKEMNWRLPGGKPSPEAVALHLVRPTDGPQPWITVWLWDEEKTLALLEAFGMVRKDTSRCAS